MDFNISALKKRNEIIQQLTGIKTTNISISGRAGMGSSVSGALGLTYDYYGNLAFQLNVNGGGGTPGLGWSGALLWTEAASYKDLEGYGGVVGGSFSPGLNIGYDQIFISNNTGSIISLGPGINLPFTAFLEAHGEAGNTWTIWKINLYDFFEDLKFKDTQECN